MHACRAWYTEYETLPLDLAGHQSVSEYKLSTNPVDFFILAWHEEKSDDTPSDLSDNFREASCLPRFRLALRPDTHF